MIPEHEKKRVTLGVESARGDARLSVTHVTPSYERTEEDVQLNEGESSNAPTIGLSNRRATPLTGPENNSGELFDEERGFRYRARLPGV